MADIFSKEKRTDVMSKVPRYDTSIEKYVRSYLFKNGFRYRKNVKSLKGTPDIVLPKFRLVIFVHGCFWHGHNCRGAHLPSTRTEFWKSKVEKNKKRDLEINNVLQNSGWKIITIWGCELKNNSLRESRLKALIEELKLSR